MISNEKINEWIREVEQRPASAALIIQYISKRLQDLTARNEELLEENIELRTERRVDEYETRIENLEYQLDLLRRQLSLETPEITNNSTIPSQSLVAYSTHGHAVRIDIDSNDLISGHMIGEFQEHVPREMVPRLLVTGQQEELLFVFDSGRTVTKPLLTVPLSKKRNLRWGSDPFVEPRGEEVLAAVLPVAKMSMYNYCLQISRKGCMRKIIIDSFQTNLSKGYIGTGIQQKPDQMFRLVLVRKEDHLVVASREGYLQSVPVDQLPYTAEETIRLRTTDFLVSAFTVGNYPTLLVMTENGKAINREMGWLATSGSSKSRGQVIFSQTRKEAGVRVASAAAVEKGDGAAILFSDGRVIYQDISDLLASGSLKDLHSHVEVVDVQTFAVPVKEKG